MATAPRPRSSRTRKTPRYQPVLELPPLPPEQHEALRGNIALHGVLVPILVDGDGPVRLIIDGNRRKGIADELGYDCPEVVKDGLSDQEKRTLARALNLARRQLDQAGKRAIIADQLRETPGRSNRWVGKQLGVHHATVASVRADLEGTGQIIQLERTVGADDNAPAGSRPDIGSRPTAGRARPRVRRAGRPADRDSSIILADFDEKSILRAALEIRQGRVAGGSGVRKSTRSGRVALGGQRTWAVTGDQEVVPCDLLVVRPPHSASPGEPVGAGGCGGLHPEMVRPWSGCGADFVAVFLVPGAALGGAALVRRVAVRLRVPATPRMARQQPLRARGHHSLKQSWYPIFLYRRKRSGRKVIRGTSSGTGSGTCSTATSPRCRRPRTWART